MCYRYEQPLGPSVKVCEGRKWFGGGTANDRRCKRGKTKCANGTPDELGTGFTSARCGAGWGALARIPHSNPALARFWRSSGAGGVVVGQSRAARIGGAVAGSAVRFGAAAGARSFFRKSRHPPGIPRHERDWPRANRRGIAGVQVVNFYFFPVFDFGAWR